MAILTGANLVGIAAGIAHALDGHPLRGAFTALSLIPNSAALLLMHKTHRVEPATHYLLACLTSVIVVSPILSESSLPVLVGLAPLPVAAIAVGGSRVGAIWTALIALILAGSAMTFPFEPAERFLAWNVLMVTIAMGSLLTLGERSRERLIVELIAARERAERHADEREQAEAALKESQAYFLEAFRRAPSMLMLMERESGKILDVNESFTRLAGFSREEAVGRTSLELDLWPDAAERERTMPGFRAGQGVTNREGPMQTRSGEIRWLLASVEALEIGGRPCTLAQAVDITARKLHDEALEQQQAELEARFEQRGRQLKASQQRLRESERLAAVGTLAAGVAHQINNPVGAIAVASESTLLGLSDPAPAEQRLSDAKAALERILEEARRCGRIVKSLLKFAREEKTSQWVEDLVPAVRRASESSRNYVDGLGGTLSVEMHADSLPVLHSPIDIEQALINLIRNAAESRTHGAAVRVETRRRGEWAEILITDDGGGIPEGDRSRVFDPFYTTRLDAGGSGLGLSVVHGVVQNHRGTLSIESPEAGGTRFRVSLPLVVERPTSERE